MANKRITLATVIEHMQHLHGIAMLRIDGLDAKIDHVHVSLSRQIDAIDKRLDAVEIEDLPRRVHKLEKAVFGS
jgi:hypothetical protein